MKIKYLTLEAPREGQASYVHVHEIINGLKNQGAHVELFEPSYTKKTKSPALFLRLMHALCLQARLWLNWQKGSTLYVRAHYLAFPSAVLAWLFSITIIHEINGPYEDVFVTHPSLNRFRRLLIFMQRWQYRKASALIAVTKELQIWANKEGDRSDCAFISNGANIRLFSPSLPKPDNLPDKYVVFFGGLTRWHGVPAMIKAVNSVEWPKDVSLLIIGDGQESEHVKKAAKTNRLIVAMGRIPYKNIAPYVSNALASLIMISDPDKRSSTGVFPLKLFESMAAGVPSIVSELPGQADLIRETKSGLVVPLDDAAELAKSVAYLSLNPDQAALMGETARENAVKDHSWEARARDTYTLITSLLVH